MKVRGKRLGFRLLALCAGLGLAFLVAELVLRWVPLVPDKSLIHYRAMPAPEYQAPRPSDRARSVLGFVEQTNKHGLRDPERPLAKGEAPRIALLGDSVAWGFGLHEGETIARQLEARLPGTEVWTLAQPATDWENHAGRFARLGPAIQPDLVLGMVLYNDLLGTPTEFRVTEGGYLATPHRNAPYPDALRPLLDRSAVFLGAMRLWYLREMARSPGEHGFQLEHLPRMLGAMDQVHAECEALGAPLILVLTPGQYEPPGGYETMREAVQAWAAQRSVSVVDLAPELGLPLRDALARPADGTHPNAAGAAAIAERLAAEVRALSAVGARSP